MCIYIERESENIVKLVTSYTKITAFYDPATFHTMLTFKGGFIYHLLNY